METPLIEIAQRVAEGTLKIPIKTFCLDQIVEAHVAMEENTRWCKDCDSCMMQRSKCE
jgi:hypothetical protein